MRSGVGVLQFQRARKHWLTPIAAAVVVVALNLPALAQLVAPPTSPPPTAAPPSAAQPAPPPPAAPKRVVARPNPPPAPARAEPASNLGTISDIKIDGLQRIEPETVHSYMLLQPGDPWDSERVDA